MKLATTIGPQEKRFDLPFGLDGYVVVRRRNHPQGGGKKFSSDQSAFMRRNAKEFEAAKRRLRKSDPELSEKAMTATFVQIHDETYAEFLEGASRPDYALDAVQDFAATLVKSWGGPCFEGQTPENAKAREVFFSEENALQVVPRFETLDGGVIMDAELTAKAAEMTRECEADVAAFREEMQARQVKVNVDAKKEAEDAVKAITAATTEKVSKLKQKKAKEAHVEEMKQLIDLTLSTSKERVTEIHEELGEELRVGLEDRHAALVEKLEAIGVRLSPHGGKRLDGALADVIIGYADEVERHFQESAGFFVKR